MPKRDPDHMAAQRTRILRATIECIAARGVEGTSIAEICRLAGLSTGALYVHFRNRDDILAETVRYASSATQDFPDDWPSFKAKAVSFEDMHGFDLVTVMRVRMHLHAEFVRAGLLHDVFRPLLENTLSALARHLQKMHDSGSVALRFSARQTAVSISAYIDGMVWIALASDRPLEELRPELSAGLDALVLPAGN
ncbi:MAG: TetR/AcrR family transcriptional regulator [Janthinobacterium lividum]